MPDRAIADFEVWDRAPLANIGPHLFLAGLCAAPLILALTHPGFQAFLENQPNGSLKGFIIAMSVVNAAMAIEVAGLFLRLLNPKPALRLTAHGVEGLYGWWWRKFAWEKVDHVSFGVNHLQIVPRDRSPIHGLLRLGRPRGDKRRAGDQIYVKLSTADREAGEILFEISRRRPELEIISSPYLQRSAQALH